MVLVSTGSAVAASVVIVLVTVAVVTPVVSVEMSLDLVEKVDGKPAVPVPTLPVGQAVEERLNEKEYEP